MLPNRGQCHGVFLLCHAARLRERSDLKDWITAASERATFMASALDFFQIASEMIRLGLAVSKNIIVIDDALRNLSTNADRTTFIAIARILVLNNPPFWLGLAVRDGKIYREYIPQEDLEDLQWIDPDLDQFLLDVHSLVPGEDQTKFRKRIGDVAELFVFAALQMAGKNPLHVAKISDAYGYDIECAGAPPDRIEVKAASIATQKSFHISRNEYDKSGQYGKSWRLIQVIFSDSAFAADTLDASHIEGIIELNFGALQTFVPPDTLNFRWSESAMITATPHTWHPAAIIVDPDFSIGGFHKYESQSSLTGN